MEIYNLEVKKSNGDLLKLGSLKGKVLLIVNTATHCGFTPQYEKLKELHNKYYDEGLEILDFPCNQFGQQAAGTIDEIIEFCTLNYNVPYKIFAKIDVNGENEEPLFKHLKEKKAFEGFNNHEHEFNELLHNLLKKENPDYEKNSDIKWNFTKFLVDKEGNVVSRFEPVDKMEKIEEEIKKLLK